VPRRSHSSRASPRHGSTSSTQAPCALPVATINRIEQSSRPTAQYRWRTNSVCVWFGVLCSSEEAVAALGPGQQCRLGSNPGKFKCCAQEIITAVHELAEIGMSMCACACAQQQTNSAVAWHSHTCCLLPWQLKHDTNAVRQGCSLLLELATYCDRFCKQAYRHSRICCLLDCCLHSWGDCALRCIRVLMLMHVSRKQV
jgi:hypothetical protein